MATTVVINPNATVLVDDVTVNGAGDADDALRDNTDASYLQYFSGTGISDVITDLESIPTLGTKRIARVKVVVRADSGNGTVRFHGRVKRNTGPTTEAESFYTTTNMVSGPRTITGAWLTSIPGTSTEWTEAEINALRLRMYDDNTGGSLPAVYRAWVGVETHDKPSVTLLSPTAGSIASTSPLVKWGFTAGGDAMWQFRVKIFSVAVAEAGGFNPEVDTTIYDSGVQNFSGTYQWQVPGGLLAANTNYYVHVKGASLFPGPLASDFWFSEWSGVKFKCPSNPSPVIVTPIGATGNANPTYSWTYSDPDGKVVDHFRLKVMTAAAYAASGSNIETAAAVYEVQLPSTALSHTASTYFLLNTTSYVAGITAYTKVPFETHGTGTNNFNTSWVAPSAPELAVTPIPSSGMVQLISSSHDNLLTANQASSEAGVGAWTTNNASVAQSSAWSAEGTKSTEITASSAANMSIVTPSHIPVIAGRTYTARATSRAVTTGRSITLFIRWFNLGGTNFASDSQTLTNNTVSDTVWGFSAVAPVGAVSADYDFSIASPANAEKHRIDMSGLMPGALAVAPWGVGGLNPIHTLQRSEDGGVTWVPIQGATGQAPDAGEVLPTYDWLATPNITLQYRAFSTSTASGVPTQSTYTVITNVTLASKLCFLKDPLDPTRNMHFLSEDTYLTRTQRRDRAFYRPLGRKKPVPMRGSGDGATFTLQVLSLTKVDQDRLRQLLEGDRTLLYQSPTESFYVELTGDYTESDYLWDKLHGSTGLERHWSVPLIEVDPVPVT